MDPLLSYAQNGEDVVLWRAFKHVTNGTYLDIGANHPKVDSITRAFYDRGWSGLLVEPNPEFSEQLRADRPRDIVREALISNRPGSKRLHAIAGTGLSTMVDAISDRHRAAGHPVVDIEVDAIGLSELIDDEDVTGDIHFAIVDTEGSELEVLRSLDFTRHRPWVLVIEATAPNSTTQVHAAWEPLVVDAGYEFCMFDGISRYYVAREHTELAAALSYPACALDDFVRYEEQRATSLAVQRAERAEAEAESLRRELAEHRASTVWRATRPLRAFIDRLQRRSSGA